MDVIYTDHSFNEKGILRNFYMDFEANIDYGAKKNTFTIDISHHDCNLEMGDYVYVHGEEYGGIVDKQNIITKTGEDTFTGRTWRGLLASKFIEPPAGEGYYTVSGDANTIIGSIINRIGLSSIFKASETANGITINNYDFRYTNAYTGIVSMLQGVEAKLVLRFDETIKKCVLSAEPIEDFSNQKYISSDEIDFRIKKDRGGVNHVIALGGGELAERTVVHRYLNANDEVVTTPYYTGADEVQDLYDYGNVESTEDLIKSTEDRLKSYITNDEINVTMNAIIADIGDKFSAYDEETGTKTIQYIDNKIVNIDDNDFKVNYTAGIVKVVEDKQINELEDYVTNKNFDDFVEDYDAFAISLSNVVEDLQNQIDGNIATWFYEVDPSMILPPVTLDVDNPDGTNWSTDELKAQHKGDLYYNIIKGYAWRFQYVNGEYSWGRITDTDVMKALEDAAKAQDTADRKRRVFVTTPTPPYDIGDLWTQGSTGDILKCVHAKGADDAYSANDWALASRYTDDTAADAAQATADTAQSMADDAQTAAGNAQTTADSAVTAAGNAQTTANNAASAASTAQTRANNAYTLASGKSKVFYSATAPISGMQENDTWFNSSEDNAIYKYNGSSWVKMELGEDAIANLAITNAKIADATIQNAKIANLDAAKITTGTMDTARLNVRGIITAGSIATQSDIPTNTSDLVNDEGFITEEDIEEVLISTQYIYKSVTSGTTSVPTYTTWVEDATGAQNTWTTKRPEYSTAYPVLFIAQQTKSLDGMIECTTPVKDDTLTVIDGGMITTGTVNTNRLNVSEIIQTGGIAITADIPTNTSDLVNDSDFATEDYVDDAEADAVSTAAADATAKANEAATKATYYISSVSGYTGICIHAQGNTTDLVNIDPTNHQIKIVRNGTVVLTLGNPVVVGDASDIHAEIGSGYMDIVQASGTQIAHFGYDYALDEEESTNDRYPYTTLGIRNDSLTIGGYSVAEGYNTGAIGYVSHAEGSNSYAYGFGSHSEGLVTIAVGGGSHSEGGWTRAQGDCSHAEGYESKAYGNYSHASGNNIIAQGKSQFVIGECNVLDTSGTATTRGDKVFIIGNGTTSARSNACAIDWNGNIYTKGQIYVGGTNADASGGTIISKSAILQAVYPVGAIYISTVSTSPATLFGFGTWERIQGQFLLGASSTYTAGSTGGEATVKLTAAQSGVPAHYHGMAHTHTAATENDYFITNSKVAKSAKVTKGSTTTYEYIYTEDGTAHSNKNTGTSSKTSTDNNTATAASSAHNNMPPYLAVYMWKRTA